MAFGIRFDMFPAWRFSERRSLLALPGGVALYLRLGELQKQKLCVHVHP